MKSNTEVGKVVECYYVGKRWVGKWESHLNFLKLLKNVLALCFYLHFCHFCSLFPRVPHYPPHRTYPTWWASDSKHNTTNSNLIKFYTGYRQAAVDMNICILWLPFTLNNLSTYLHMPEYASHPHSDLGLSDCLTGRGLKFFSAIHIPIVWQTLWA